MGKLISITEYAALHGKASVSVRQKARLGGFKTAQKIGHSWVIDSDEPYLDKRKRSDNLVEVEKATDYHV